MGVVQVVSPNEGSPNGVSPNDPSVQMVLIQMGVVQLGVDQVVHMGQPPFGLTLFSKLDPLERDI